MKVLLIDDDRDLIDLLRYSFQRNGYKVVVAFDGEMGLQTFASEEPDLIVLDLGMPKRDGMQVLKEIRRTSPKTKILVLTVHENIHYAVKVLQKLPDSVVSCFLTR